MALQDTSGPDRDPAPGPARVLVVGAASRDLTSDDPRGWRLGGAVTYGALTLARLGLEVRAIVGADAAAARASELDLLAGAGVEIQLVPLRRGPVFVNAERPSGREQLAVEVADPIDFEALPTEWAASDALLLAPVAGELGPEWANAIVDLHTRPAEGRVVGIGWQGLLRTLASGEPVRRRPPGPSALLRAATIVGLSQTDVHPETPLRTLEGFLETTTTLAITNGERGGLIGEGSATGRSRRWRSFPAIPADRIVDPTGAGDVLLATLLAMRLDPHLLGAVQGRSDIHDGPGQDRRGADLRLAAAAASLVVEAPGLLGVPTLDALLRRATRAVRAASS